MPITSGWSFDCRSISSKLSTIMLAKSRASIWRAMIIGMSFSSFGPGIVEDVGLGALRPERRAQAGAELEVLDVEADVDREALAARPVVVPAVDDGRVIVPAVGFEGALHQIRAWRGRRAPKATRRCRSRRS